MRTITKNERRGRVKRGWWRTVRNEDDYEEQEDEAEQNGDSDARVKILFGLYGQRVTNTNYRNTSLGFSNPSSLAI